MLGLRWTMAGFLVALIVPSLRAQTTPCTSWRLDEVARIGSLDGDDALTWVMDLSVAPNGNLYVAQSFTASIAEFTPDGELLRRIGRAGQGPGEFDVTVVRLGWLDDALWASDLRTLHFFGADGVEVRRVSFRTPVPGEGSTFTPGSPLADGTVLGFRFLGPGHARLYAADRVPLVRWSTDGEVVDTIGFTSRRVVVSQGGLATEHPLDSWLGESRLPVAVTPDGTSVLLVGEVRQQSPRSSFDLIRLAINGDTLLARTIDYQPKPVTAREAAWLSEAFGKHHAGDYYSGSRGGNTTDAGKEVLRRRARGAISFPTFHPPVRRIVAGLDGTIWLLRELEYPELRDRWDVYSESGILEGRVEVSEGRGNTVPWEPRLNVFHATRRAVWGTTIEEFDVSYVHRYRVDRDCG